MMFNKNYKIFPVLLCLLFSIELVAQAGFTATSVRGCSPMSVTLSDTTRNNATATYRRWSITGPGGANFTSTWPVSGGLPNNNFTVLLTVPGCYTVTLTDTIAGVGQTVTRSRFICVNGNPRVGGTLNPSNGFVCPGATVTYTPNILPGDSCSGIDSIIVDWQGGTPAIQKIIGAIPASITHNYPGSAGQCYIIRVTAFNRCGCVATGTIDTVCVAPAVQADFTIADNYNCAAPFTTQLIATQPSPSTGYTFQWYRNTTTSAPVIPGNTATVNATFPSGTHPVTMVATNTITGCSAVVTKNAVVTVGNVQAPTFTTNFTSGCRGINILYTNTTVGQSSCTWHIYGVTPSVYNTCNPPLIQYPNAGTYTATLITTYAGGCVDSIRKVNFLTIGNPIALDFNTVDSIVCSVPDTIQLNYTGAPIPAGSTVSWSLTDVNGSPVPCATAVGSTNQPSGASFRVNCFGQYRGTLNVTDPNGCVSTLVIDTPNPIVRVAPLRAVITKSRVGGCVGDTFVLVNRTPLVGGCPFNVKQWITNGLNIIPNISGSQDTLRFTINATGCYKFKFVIANLCGCRDTLNDSVQVGKKIPFTVSISPKTLCFEEVEPEICVTLTDTPAAGCGGPLKQQPHDRWCWLPYYPYDSITKVCFVDSAIVSDTLVDLQWCKKVQFQNLYPPNPIDTFFPHFFYVNNGCSSDTVLIDTVVVKAPIANYRELTRCGNLLQRCFINTSLMSDTTYLVIYNTCADSAATDSTVIPYRHKSDTICYTFPSCGCFSFKVVAYNDTTMCTHFKKATVNVQCGVNNFTATRTRGCITQGGAFNTTFSPFPAILPGSGIDSVQWKSSYPSGNWLYGDPAAGWAINSAYVTPGIYNVAMRIKYRNGCYDTIIKPNFDTVTRILPSFNITPNYGCVPLTVNIANTSTSQPATLPSTVASVSYFDNFGNTSNSANPSFTYTALGPFSITQSVTSIDGCVYTSSNQVFPNLIDADFIVPDDTSCTNSSGAQPITFINTTAGLNTTYRWVTTPDATNPVDSSTDFTTTYTTQGQKQVCLYVFDSVGFCRDTACKTLFIRNPVACFTLNDTFAPCPILFVDTTFQCSTGSQPLTYNWNFGDGSPNSTDPNPKHIYYEAGTFPITLTVTDADGCTNVSAPRNVIIDGPKADLVVSTQGGCPCLPIRYQLTLRDANSATLYLGCGGISRSFPNITTNPFIFDTTYTFCSADYCNPFVVMSDGNCTYTDTVLISPVQIDSPRVNFRVTNRACGRGQLCFQDQSTNSLAISTFTRYFWDWGDGSPIDSTSGANACHNYTSPGWKRVTHCVRNSARCYKCKLDSFYIPIPPDANFRADSIGCRPLNSSFTPTVVVDPRTSISTYAWSFNDPSSTMANNFSNLPNPTHLYNSAGTFNAQLIVVDTFGCKDTVVKPIIVYNQPPVNAGADRTICLRDSTTLTVAGSNSCSWLPATNIMGANTCNPRVFPTTNTCYTVIVTDVNGCRGYDTVCINVSSVDASFRVDTVCINSANRFISTSTTVLGTINNCSWTFGDATTGSGCTTTHIYPSATCYTATLTATNSFGCRDTAIRSACVSPPPTAAFTNDTACNGSTTRFINTSNPGFGFIDSVLWNFGDGTSSRITNPTHVYAAQGTYSVSLTVCNNGGCCNTVQRNVLVRRSPKANFTSNAVCLGDSTSFISTSLNGTGIITDYLWQFNSPNMLDTSTRGPSVTFLYTTAGNKNIRLRVTDQFGCRSDTTKTVAVNAKPTANFNFNNGCIGAPTNFTDLSTVGTRGIQTWIWSMQNPTATYGQKNPTHSFNTIIALNPVKLVVIDSAGCSDSIAQNVPVTDRPTARITSPDTVVCLGESITLNDASTPGISSPIATVAWDMQSDGTIDFPNQSSVTFTYPSEGSYRACALVSDAHCTDTACMLIRINALPVASFGGDSNCIGVPSNFVSTSQPGDAPIITHIWLYGNPPLGIDSPNATSTYAFTVSGPQEVTLQVIDANGCTDNVTNTINVPLSADVNVITPDTTVCPGYSVTIGVTGVYDNISWSPTIWIDNPYSDTITVTPQQTIQYVVNATKGVCPTDHDTVIVNVVPRAEITATANPNTVSLGLSSDINSQISTFSDIDSVVWSPADNLSCRVCPNSIATPTQTTVYTAMVYYSKNGVQCIATDSVEILVITTCDSQLVYIPNTFSPNADGENDVFRIRSNGLAKVNYFRIFDRWGKLIFEASDISNNNTDSRAWWNGGLGNDLGQPMNTGVYVYHFEVECVNGNKTSGKGNVSLIR